MKHTKIKIAFRILSLCLVIGVQSMVVPSAHAVTGSDWRAGHIIDNSVFYDSNSMSVDQIQQFLNSRVPNCDNWGTQPYNGTTRRAYSESKGIIMPLTCLKNYQENTGTHESNLDGHPVPANSKGSAQIIWEAAQQYGISPKVLLVLLQKEQGLVQDDWPWPVQYKSATGYGCPDTAACDSQYYGFFNQVSNAARQFRLYANNPGQYNYIPGSGNNIQYNPNASCGSSSVTIDNQATASLYNYTPYQPNQAALDNLYGTGDSCSAYGNRNFWRIFNDWFGSGSGVDPQLVMSDSSTAQAQYVLYGSILYPISSPEVKAAWGLLNTPISRMSQSYISSLRVGAPLTRVVQSDGDPTTYLVDNGLKYGFPTAPIMGDWNTNTWDPGTGGVSSLPKAITDLVGTSMTLGQVVHAPAGGGPTIYLVDGGVLHPIDNPDTLTAWQGNSNTAIVPSDSLFRRYTVGSPVSTFKVQSGSGQTYIVDAGMKLLADSTTFNAFPGPSVTLGDPLVNSLINGPSASPIIRSPSDATTYLTDGGQLHGFVAPSHLMAYSNNGQIPVTMLTQGHLNKVAHGFDMNTFLATDPSGSTTYLMNGTKQPIPSSQLSNFTSGGHNPLTLSSGILSLMNSGPQVTRFVRVPGQPGVNIIANGNYKTFPTPQDFQLWGGDNSQITNISQEVLSQFNFTGAVTAYVSDGTNNYLLGKPGIMYSVGPGTANNWRLGGAPTQLTQSALAGLANGGELPSAFRIGSNVYLMRKNIGYGSNDSNMLTLWGLNGSMPDLDPAVSKFFTSRSLTKYVTSSDANDGKIYLTSSDNTKPFLHIASPVAMQNLGYGGEVVVDVNANDINFRGTTEWNNTIVSDGQGGFFTLDAGAKRQINPAVAGQWTNNQALPVQIFSPALLSQFNAGPSVNKSIRTSDDTKIYAVVNGQKQWITSPQTFIQGGYAPESLVSSLLRDSLPTGPNL